MITNQGYVSLSFYTSKEWHYSVIFNSVLPDYVSVSFNRNFLSMDIEDSIPEMFNMYYVNIFDKLSGALLCGKEIEYRRGIYDMPFQENKEIIIYFSYATYDSELGKYVASQLIAHQEFFVPKGW